MSSIDNLSDHDAIICEIDLDITYLQRAERQFIPKAAWYKANDSMIKEYQSCVDLLLSGYDIDEQFLTCHYVKCTQHFSDITDLLGTIVHCCLQAEDAHIPKTGPRQKHRIPGWSDHVSGKRSEALHWHHVWVNQGRPKTGTVKSEMVRTRKEYHYAIRHCKRNENRIKSQKMAEAIGKNGRDLWCEVQRLSKVKQCVPTTIDGVNNNQGIMDIFHDKFRDLYCSVPSSEEGMMNLIEQINGGLPEQVHPASHVLNFDLEKVIKKLKAGKMDGYLGISSDCIINAPLRMKTLIALLFRAMTIHGFAPDALLVGTMSPIPKTKGFVSSSDKYRAITLISCIMKLYDYVVLDGQAPSLITDNLQFGFKEKCSTTMCTAMVSEIAKLFKSRGGTTYAVMLDATKAFDRVEHLTLFSTLLEKGMDSLFVRLLIYMYVNQKLRVKWNNAVSETFEVHNGVKQGGVLSPVLFGIHLDSLINQLRQSGYGCYIGPYFLGCIAYADDLVLISPTIKGLQNMLKISKDYSTSYKVQFNGTKSQFIIFNEKVKSETVAIDVFGITLKNLSKVCHLGHILYADLHSDDLDSIIASYYRQYNSFRGRFGEIASYVQATLFNNYCCSFYGSLLLHYRKLERLCVVWRKSLRSIWRLPARTHCAILPGLSGGQCPRHAFLARFSKFAVCVLQHKTPEISFAFSCFVNAKHSIFRANIGWVCCELSIPYDDEVIGHWNSEIVKKVQRLCKDNCKTVMNSVASHTVRELTMVRDGLCSLELNDFEINFIIMDTCIS